MIAAWRQWRERRAALRRPPVTAPEHLTRISRRCLLDQVKTWCAAQGFAAVLAPWPGDDSLPPGDGYVQRVRMIDQTAFSGVNRVYIYNSPFWTCGELGAFSTDDEKVRYLIVNDSVPSHMELVRTILHKARVVYVHSVFRLLKSIPLETAARLIDPKEIAPKLIVDLHGAVHAEMALNGRDVSAVSAAREMERACMEHAALCIAVTRRMISTLETELETRAKRALVIPIADGDDGDMRLPEKSDAETVCLYSGGVQAWQLVDEMLQAVADAAVTNVRFDFYVNDPAGFAVLLQRVPCAKKINYATILPTELPTKYAQAHYGFILRDATTVNRVACPTKLMEYLRYGLIPIMKSSEIGDFCDMGMRFVRLEDLVAGRLPDAEKQQAMREANMQVLLKLRQARKDGLSELKMEINSAFSGTTD